MQNTHMQVMHDSKWPSKNLRDADIKNKEGNIEVEIQKDSQDTGLLKW